eukprot:6908432-Alexandrium_andersonii.AAC.1
MSHRWSGGASAAPSRSAASTPSSGGTSSACGAQIDWSPLPVDEPVGRLGGWVPSERISGSPVPN